MSRAGSGLLHHSRALGFGLGELAQASASAMGWRRSQLSGAQGPNEPPGTSFTPMSPRSFQPVLKSHVPGATPTGS